MTTNAVTVIQPPGLQNLSPQARTYAMAFQSHKLSDFDETEKTRIVLAAIQNCAISHGIAMDSQDLAWLAKAAIDSCHEEFPALRGQEFQHCLKLASTGTYGKTYGKLTLALVMDWIREYRQSEDRREAIEALSRAQAKAQATQDQEKPKPTPAQIHELSILSVIADYQAWLATGQPRNPGNTTFDFLNQNEIIYPTQEQIEALASQIQTQKLEFLEVKKRTVDRITAIEIGNEIQRWQTQAQTSIQAAKTHMLKILFEDWKTKFHNEESISDYLRAFTTPQQTP